MKLQRIGLFMIAFAFLTAVAMSCFTGCKEKDNNPEPGTIKDYDGNVYHTVTIDTTVWLLENLKTTHYRDGAPITEGGTAGSLKNTASEGIYWNYNNDPAMGDIYGRLYNWYALSAPAGIAPEGFHIASDEEWTAMMEFLGGDMIAGGKLKEAGTTHWDSPNAGATNESGFTGLPAGSWYAMANYFTGLGGFAGFWTSTESGTYFAWGRSLSSETTQIYRGDTNKEIGYSVRCVKN